MHNPADSNRTVIVIPTYNESENIRSLTSRLRKAVPDADLLIVDDGSPDGTGQIVDELAASDSHVRILHRTEKNGLGSAYRAGFALALEGEYDVVVQMDADGSHRPEELPRLLAALGSAQLAVGSRWVAGGAVVGWPLSRRLLSRGGSAFARISLGLRQRDITGGFRAFRTDALRVIRPGETQSQGYSFQVEMLWRAVSAGLTVREVPITFADREYGSSKMTGRIVIEAMSRVAMWGMRYLPERVANAMHPAPERRHA